MGRIAIIIGATLAGFLLLVGLAWYQHSLPPPALKTYKGLARYSSNDVLSVRMECMAEQAALDAWNRTHIRVHIGIHALPEFERYLDRIARSSWYQGLSLKDKEAEAIIDGAFVGEAIRRTHGGVWLEKSDLPEDASFPLQIGDHEIFPITWCRKRLMNGPEENIYAKYLLLILQRTNEVHGEMTYWTNTGTELKQVTNLILK